MSRLGGQAPSSASEPSVVTTRRHKPDLLMLLFLSILLLLGLVVIYAISPALTARITGGQDLDQNLYMYRQVAYLAVGLAAFTVTYFIPATFWQKLQGRLVLAALILGAAPFMLQLTPVGLCTNDACRWLDFGIVTFQPAEFMKLALVIFLAGFLAARMQQGLINDVKQTLVPASILLLVMAFIVVVLQRDLGTGLTVFGIFMTVLFAAGVRLKLIGAITGVILLFGVLTIATAPHRIERVLTFIGHESVESDDMGHHINQALIAVGSGGVTGKGLGQSIQAFGYLPEAANDSIFAILAEKFGFIGTTLVLVLFAALFARILGIMDHTANPYFRLVVAGVFGWVFSHTIVNIGAMLGIFPLTGITLPFVSFGGTSLLFMLCALGIVFQISRYTSHRKFSDNPKTGGVHDHRLGGRGIRGARNPSTGRN